MSVRARARDLGIAIGTLKTGQWNAITDVAGVRVGFSTLIDGDGPLVVGQGPVRTGVTAVFPRDEVFDNPVFAGYHQLNGNGEMTGIAWIEESGILTSPIGITNTHSVGVVRDAFIQWDRDRCDDPLNFPWRLPVVSETSDMYLNDINGFHVKPEHAFAALESARSGPVAEGNVGGGAGMICHEFKGGTGTSSRVLDAEDGGWTVGVLVQANYGQRRHFRVDGVPVGRELGTDVVPSPRMRKPLIPTQQPGDGSIVVIIATDAPLLPNQCKRLAQRATLGVARVGGNGDNGSGDLFLAFSTGNHGIEPETDKSSVPVLMTPNSAISKLFEAVADATEEAILNAVCMAETMTGSTGRTVHELPLDRLKAVMAAYGHK
jgi:D-aminopeptidase